MPDFAPTPDTTTAPLPAEAPAPQDVTGLRASPSDAAGPSPASPTVKASVPQVAGSLWSVPDHEQISAAQRLHALGLQRLHWDMSDGHFAAAGGFTAARAQEIAAATGLGAEAHLMADQPITEVDAWTDFCDLVVVHAESQDWIRALDRIAARGATPGVAISPQTPVSVVPADLPVLCMAITPGTAGSTFSPEVLNKVAALREASATRRIGIDGGVKRDHAEQAAAAGVDWVVVGTDLFLGGGERRWSDLLTSFTRA